MFCGLCIGEQCIDLQVEHSSCNSTTVCILPNNTIAINMTATECGSTYQCTITSCDDNNTTTCQQQYNETECSNMGVCSDIVYFQSISENGTVTMLSGICVLPREEAELGGTYDGNKYNITINNK